MSERMAIWLASLARLSRSSAVVVSSVSDLSTVGRSPAEPALDIASRTCRRRPRFTGNPLEGHRRPFLSEAAASQGAPGAWRAAESYSRGARR